MGKVQKLAWGGAILGMLLMAVPRVGNAQPEDKNTSLFGSTTRSESALIGILYDLKQTQTHEPTGMGVQSYMEVFARFVDSDWDEAILNQYYRVTRPLYTTQVFIPDTNADAAPKAFGVEQLVKPGLWMVHYKGQVAAPEGGTYRFVGCADDVMAVAVNGKTVLVVYSSQVRVKWYPQEQSGMRGSERFDYTAGDWFEVKAGKPIDLDIIIGECPGGLFCSQLALQRKGVTYPADKRGVSLVPPFQLSATALTAKYPAAQIWKGCQ